MNLKELSNKLYEEIDDYCINTYDDGLRSHLGISIIGGSCLRKLWYGFRWVAYPTYGKDKRNSARTLRLFQRGHLEENRFVEYLRGIGCEVLTKETQNLYYHDASNTLFYDWKENASNNSEILDVTGITSFEKMAIDQNIKPNAEPRQFLISSLNGHYGGSLDCRIVFPKRFGFEKPLVGEFKTKGTGAKFNEICKKGVQSSEIQHFTQASCYGADPCLNFDYGVYLVANKNDDDLHVEFFELDKSLPEKMKKRAALVINSNVPPAKLSESGSATDCKMCDFSDVCHKNKPAIVNCRSCKYSKPIENSNWFCEGWRQVIPKDKIKNGCSEWADVSKLQTSLLSD